MTIVLISIVNLHCCRCCRCRIILWCAQQHSLAISDLSAASELLLCIACLCSQLLQCFDTISWMQWRVIEIQLQSQVSLESCSKDVLCSKPCILQTDRVSLGRPVYSTFPFSTLMLLTDTCKNLLRKSQRLTLTIPGILWTWLFVKRWR